MPTLAEEFAAFWACYPSRVGKLAAEQEYVKARRRASAQDILDGVARYKAGKPEWKEWCNPRTFLHQGRWMDEYDVPAPVHNRREDDCTHTPECPTRIWCRVRQARDRGEVA